MRHCAHSARYLGLAADMRRAAARHRLTERPTAAAFADACRQCVRAARLERLGKFPTLYLLAPTGEAQAVRVKP